MQRRRRVTLRRVMASTARGAVCASAGDAMHRMRVVALNEQGMSRTTTIRPISGRPCDRWLCNGPCFRSASGCAKPANVRGRWPWTRRSSRRCFWRQRDGGVLGGPVRSRCAQRCDRPLMPVDTLTSEIGRNTGACGLSAAPRSAPPVLARGLRRAASRRLALTATIAGTDACRRRRPLR